MSNRKLPLKGRALSEADKLEHDDDLQFISRLWNQAKQAGATDEDWGRLTNLLAHKYFGRLYLADRDEIELDAVKHIDHVRNLDENRPRKITKQKYDAAKAKMKTSAKKELASLLEVTTQALRDYEKRLTK